MSLTCGFNSDKIDNIKAYLTLITFMYHLRYTLEVLTRACHFPSESVVCLGELEDNDMVHYFP